MVRISMHYEKIREFATLHPGMYQGGRGNEEASIDPRGILGSDWGATHILYKSTNKH